MQITKFKNLIVLKKWENMELFLKEEFMKLCLAAKESLSILKFHLLIMFCIDIFYCSDYSSQEWNLSWSIYH